ncbi:MAG: hypothetical protein ABSA45_05920 [Verrucomicrobiota bacterium]
MTLAPGALAWTLPGVQAPGVSASAASLLMAIAAPLYARNCARLV